MCKRFTRDVPFLVRIMLIFLDFADTSTLHDRQHVLSYIHVVVLALLDARKVGGRSYACDCPAQVVNETLPALQKLKEQGLVRFIGFTGLPLKVYRYILDRCAQSQLRRYTLHLAGSAHKSLHTIQNCTVAMKVIWNTAILMCCLVFLA